MRLQAPQKILRKRGRERPRAGIEGIRIGLLLARISVVQAGHGKQHGALRVGLPDHPQWPDDFLRGLIGGADGRDHQVGSLVERRQVGRRIIAGLAQAARVEKPDNRHFLVGETEETRVSRLGSKTHPDHGIRRRR